jgi:hypothetical protein
LKGRAVGTKEDILECPAPWQPINLEVGVERGDCDDPTALAQSREQRVSQIGRKVVVLFHDLNHPGQIFAQRVVDLDHRRQPVQEPEQARRYIGQHGRDLPDNQGGRDQTALANSAQKLTRLLMVGIVAVEHCDHRSSINDDALHRASP